MADDLRRTVGNRIPILAIGRDLIDDADLVVRAGNPGEIVLDINTTDGEGLTVSLDAGAAAHLIHLVAGELAVTKPLHDFYYDGR